MSYFNPLKRLTLAATVALALAPAAAFAQDAGSDPDKRFSVVAGYAHMVPKSEPGTIVGSDADLDGQGAPTLSGSWHVTDDIAVELWGAGKVDAALVRGSFLNDLHLAVALRRARDTGWVVRTNPYEGGSDHTVFTRAGVPALLNWHFTDRYYHTNLDTIDKTSEVTMFHVATIVATSAAFLASADAADESALVRMLDEAERARLETEQRNGASEEIVAAWKRWYQEARASVGTIVR